jgi:hypothetical protein
MPLRQCEAIAVATSQQFILAMIAIPPDGADRVNDPPGRQTIALCDSGLAGWTTAERATLLQQLRPRRSMNGPIHTAATKQRRVRRVDDGVDLLFRDVAFDNSNSILKICHRCVFSKVSGNPGLGIKRVAAVISFAGNAATVSIRALMTHEESLVLDFLKSSPETSYARKEIARKAIKRSDYELNQHWADQPLQSLVARGLVEIDEGGLYRFNTAGRMV